MNSSGKLTRWCDSVLPKYTASRIRLFVAAPLKFLALGPGGIANRIHKRCFDRALTLSLVAIVESTQGCSVVIWTVDVV